MSYLNTTYHIPKFGGDIWYVSKSGNDSNSGKTPTDTMLTIKAAVAASSAGDAISVKAGTYDEIDLVIANAGTEVWGEIGTLINNTDSGGGTCVQVTGTSCKLIGLKVSQAGQIGFDIDGAGCFLDHCIAEDCTIAFDVDGAECILQYCEDYNATTTGYDIATEENLLYLCHSIGTGGDTSRGFYLSNGAAHNNMLYQCVSVGNDTAGYEVVAGADYNVIAYCTSGGGDAKWVDAGTNNTWPAFQFDDEVAHSTDISSPTAAGIDNLFKITGCVNILFIYGDVEEAIDASVNNIKLTAYDSNAATDITGNVDTDSAPIGSMFIKTKELGQAMALEKSGAITVNEDSTGKKGALGFILTAKAGANNYIRAEWSGADSVGEIHWHCQWEPLDEDGFVEAV